jgi:hypothetical protein
MSLINFLVVARNYISMDIYISLFQVMKIQMKVNAF